MYAFVPSDIKALLHHARTLCCNIRQNDATEKKNGTHTSDCSGRTSARLKPVHQKQHRVLDNIHLAMSQSPQNNPKPRAHTRTTAIHNQPPTTRRHPCRFAPASMPQKHRSECSTACSLKNPSIPRTRTKKPTPPTPTPTPKTCTRHTPLLPAPLH